MELSNIFSRPEIIWFFIGLIFILAEFAVPGLIIIFFGVGAWLTALVCLFFDIGFNFQLVLFISTSILSLLLLRNFIKRIFYDKDDENSNDLQDEFIGKTGTVSSDIKGGKQGKVEFRGTDWNSVADQDIKKGSLVRIISKDSIVLKVEPLK